MSQNRPDVHTRSIREFKVKKEEIYKKDSGLKQEDYNLKNTLFDFFKFREENDFHNYAIYKLTLDFHSCGVLAVRYQIKRILTAVYDHHIHVDQKYEEFVAKYPNLICEHNTMSILIIRDWIDNETGRFNSTTLGFEMNKIKEILEIVTASEKSKGIYPEEDTNSSNLTEQKGGSHFL